MTTIKAFTSIQEMNDDDVNFVLSKPLEERIAYFQTINQQFYKDGSELRAFREYFRWLSLLDDHHLQKCVDLK